MLCSGLKLSTGLLCLGLAVSMGCSKAPDNSAADAATKAANAAKAKSEQDDAAAKLAQQQADDAAKVAEQKAADAQKKADDAQRQADDAQISQQEAADAKVAAAQLKTEADQQRATADKLTADLDSKREAAESAMNAVKELKLNAKNSIDELIANLANGESSPVLFVVWGDSERELNSVQSKLSQIDSSGLLVQHSKEYGALISDRNQYSSDQYVGTYLVNIDSAQKFDDVYNFIQDKTKLSFAPIAVQSGRIRTFMTVTYTSGKDPVRFWIGESADFNVSADSVKKTITGADVGLYTPNFDGCSDMEVSCLKSIVPQGYLTKGKIVPATWLAGQVNESLTIRSDAESSVFNRQETVFSSSVIKNIVISHELWVHSSDTRDAARVGNFVDGNKESITIKVTPQDVLYKAPVDFSTVQIDKETRGTPYEMTTLMKHLSKYLASVQVSKQ